MAQQNKKESLPPQARQSTGDNLSPATVETDDRLQFIMGGGSGQDPRQRVLDQLDHSIDHGALNRWFVANHGRLPGAATISFFEAAAVWIEEAYFAGRKGFPLSHAIPWLKSKIDIFGGTENE